MNQEMPLRDLLAQNRGLRVNGQDVQHQVVNSAHYLVPLNDFSGLLPMPINLDHLVTFQGNRAAVTLTFGKKIELEFQILPWTIKQMFQVSPQDSSRVVSPASLAWQKLLEDLKVDPPEFQKLLARYCKHFDHQAFNERAHLHAVLTSNNMTPEDFNTAMLVISQRYLQGAPTAPRASVSEFSAPLDILIVAAHAILVDDRATRMEDRKDGKLVFVMDSRNPLMVDTLEFDPNGVVHVVDGEANLYDAEGKLHRFTFIQHAPLSKERVDEASKTLAKAVTGVPA